jgi:hypothetical protein
MSRLRKDRLDVSVYARHGDTCSLAPHCKSLGCASGYEPDDYVLSARFAYLQEAIDYAMAISARGVQAKLISRIGPTPYVSDYPKKREVSHVTISG